MNGVVSNLPEFGKAFDAKPRSPRAPALTCLLAPLTYALRSAASS
ncbi:hypothetical protein [Tunturiibacter gelidoferens]